MNLNEISKLPDIMSTEMLHKYFTRYLDYIENLKSINSLEVLESLSELADRKVYTYELLEDSLRTRLDTFVQKLWDVSSVELVDLFASVVVNLNLKKSYELMRVSLNTSLDTKVRKIIEETIDEIGDDIEVPFKFN